MSEKHPLTEQWFEMLQAYSSFATRSYNHHRGIYNQIFEDATSGDYSTGKAVQHLADCWTAWAASAMDFWTFPLAWYTSKLGAVPTVAISVDNKASQIDAKNAPAWVPIGSDTVIEATCLREFDGSKELPPGVLQVKASADSKWIEIKLIKLDPTKDLPRDQWHGRYGAMVYASVNAQKQPLALVYVDIDPPAPERPIPPTSGRSPSRRSPAKKSSRKKPKKG